MPSGNALQAETDSVPMDVDESEGTLILCIYSLNPLKICHPRADPEPASDDYLMFDPTRAESAPEDNAIEEGTQSSSSNY